MDFIIIYPPSSNSRGEQPKMPMGGLFLAEALESTGYSVCIIDGSIEEIIAGMEKSAVTETIAFGISTLSGLQLSNAIVIAEKLKEKFPSKPLIWGGAHVTALPEQTLSSELVDFVVWGEGEVSLPQLLAAIKNNGDFGKIRGIGYKKNGKNFITPKADFTPLDKVINLPYHLLDMEKYVRKLNCGIERGFSIYTSRGCPFGCKFCSNSSTLWPNLKVRYNTFEHVINDINTLVRDYKADGITFADEIFVFNEKRLVEVCNVLKQNGLTHLKFRASARVDVLSKLHKETWDLLKETGFVGFAIGLESGSQRVLDFIGKGITLEQIYKVDALLTEYHFNKTYNFMACIPGETIDDVRQTLILLRDLAKTSKYIPYPFGTLSKFIPLPNTELYNIAVENGFRVPTEIGGWTGFDLRDKDGRDEVRPWASKDLIEYVDSANIIIRELNNLFTGENADTAKIDRVIEKLENFIALPWF